MYNQNEYIKQYNVDMSNVDKKFDLIGDTFTHYSTTDEVNKQLSDTKQATLDQAVIDAQAKIDSNNENVIKKWINDLTGQSKKDREELEKAILAAKNEAINTAEANAEKYYAAQKIKYDQLDQNIKDVLQKGSDALTKSNAIINDSLSNWDRFGKLVAGGMGLYCTKINSGENGGTKIAFHNAQYLEWSSTIWYVTSNGIVWTNSASGVNANNIDSFAQYWGTALTADGSMVLNEIKAKRISGQYITAGTITSREIASNTIVGDNIVGGTITGSKIAAGQIYATNLARDAVFAFVWEYSGTSIGSGDQYANR